MSKNRKVPVLKLSDYTHSESHKRSQFIEQLFMGFKEYGFVVLREHPIDKKLLHQAYDLSSQFFHLETSTKSQYSADHIGGQRGYTSFGKEHAKDADVMDLKEFWHVGQENPVVQSDSIQKLENVWPKEIPEFKPTFLKMYSELERVGQLVLEALTLPLELPKDYFTQMTTQGNSILRLLYYPPIPEGVDPRCVRAAAHEDINLITLLVSASASGLQLQDRDGQWLDIESDPDDLIVDSGDMLARITNEVIPATTHRVINPDNKSDERFSMPFFMHPHSQAQLKCISSCTGSGAKYPDILADEFLKQRLKEIGLS